MRRIILDCDLMRYKDSGLYHYCLNLGIHVKKLLDAERGQRIGFYVPPAERTVFGEDALAIPERKWHQKYFRPILRNCDIWHAPFQSGRVIPAGNKRIRVVLTIHDLNCLHEGKSLKQQKDSLLKTQRLVDSSHAIICISNHCKKDVLEHIDVKGKPVHVIHNGTHHVHTPPVRPAGYWPTRPFLFAMGYVNRKKNFHTLVPLVKEQNQELLIAGKLDEPDYVRMIRQLAVAYGVADRVHILGPVPETDKAWYLQHCTAFMMPSLAEGFGAPVVEAMAFGKPLFLSNRTSLPEIGTDVAFYFPDFDEENMRRVFFEGMQEFGRNGLSQRIINRGKEFSWEEKARQYIEVYRSLM